jgi:DNA modification methylase
MAVSILKGDCRDVLRTLPDESVHCVVTSPPYFGLRDYGVAGQIGLEPSPDAFVEEMVAVFRDARRVLRADGTFWLNLGDSYTSGGRDTYGTWSPDSKQATHTAIKSATRAPTPAGLKPKDLIGIPWRVAFALQADGWYLRQDIIWSKPNPMPESVRDRCTKAHEYLFLLSKSERYYFDQDAILEECSPNTHARLAQDVQAQIGSDRAHAGGKTNGNMKAVARRGGGNRSHKHTEAYEGGAAEHRTKAGLIAFSDRQRKLAEAGSGIKNNDSFDAAMAIMPTKRNRRSVWTVPTEGYSEAHFATFPPALIEPCIKAGCPAGGTVIDPFGGAGTTGMVADRLGRNAILIELNPEYAAMAERRIRGDAGMFAEVTA